MSSLPVAPHRRLARLLAILALGHVLLAGVAEAQNYPKVAPRLPEASPPAVSAPPADSGSAPERRPDSADPVLLPVLRVFLIPCMHVSEVQNKDAQGIL